MGASKAQRAATAERRTKAIKLRMAGAEWEDIARQLGYADKGAACKDVTRAMEQRIALQQETVEELRAAEVARLDRLQLGLWSTATGGDYRAAGVVRQIIADRCKLTGVDVPPDVEERIRQEVTARVGAQMATVWGQVLAGLALTPEQSARVQPLLETAIRAFTGQAKTSRRAIDGQVVDDERVAA